MMTIEGHVSIIRGLSDEYITAKMPLIYRVVVQSSPKDWHIFSTSENPKMCQSLGEKIFDPKIAVFEDRILSGPSYLWFLGHTNIFQC